MPQSGPYQARTPSDRPRRVPTPPAAPLSQEGIASWYGPGFHGKKTASGAVYDQHGMTAAHQTLPLGSRVEVTNLANGKSVTVLINDRGPFVKNRVIDLSYAAARAVDMIRPGTAPVRVDVVDTGGHALTAIPERLDYTLQVGAFTEMEKAEALKARLERRYDRPVVIEVHERYYRVRLGTFVDYAAARTYGARLHDDGLPSVVVEKGPAAARGAADHDHRAGDGGGRNAAEGRGVVPAAGPTPPLPGIAGP